ncbi:hypothetical protein Tco_0948356 [Tanacetum coccineum]
MYMAQIQEVTPDAVENSGPIFDVEPLQKVQNNNDNYNVFAAENEYPKQPQSVNDTYLEEQGDTNITIDSLDMCYDKEQDDQDDTDELAQERELLASLINKLKCEINDSKTRNKFLKSSNKALVDKLKVLQNLSSLRKLKERIHDIGCYNDNLAVMLALESDETIRLAKESQSKLSDLIKPFDYDKLNNLYDLFVPQREKSPTQQYFSKESKMSHASANNEISNESFNKQTTLLEKRMDESILWDQKCKSSKELFKIKRSVDTIFDGVERCKQIIAKRTYFGNIDPFIQNTIEGKFCPQIRRINADLEKFHLCLKEEMVADLRYFNSLKHEVDSLKSQLETQKTQFLNEIDRLSREYYYADHMNAILGVYTDLQPIVVPISSREPKQNVNQSAATFYNKIVATDSTVKKPRNIIRKIYEQVSKTCSWWYPKFTPPGYKWKPRSITGNVNPNVIMPLGNASRTANTLEPITPRCSTLSNTPLSSNSFAARTVKFRNDQIAPILGYEDLVQGTITIKRVYYVEGLNHNLFSVSQFCDTDLEVAFWKSTCYIRDLKGNDLLTGSRGTDLYSSTLQETSIHNPICLMAKATSS